MHIQQTHAPLSAQRSDKAMHSRQQGAALLHNVRARGASCVAAVKCIRQLAQRMHASLDQKQWR